MSYKTHSELQTRSLTYDNLVLDGFPEGVQGLPGEEHEAWRKLWTSKDIVFENPSQLKKVYSVALSYHIPSRFADFIGENPYGLDTLPDYQPWQVAVFFEWVDKDGVYHPADMGSVIQPEYWEGFEASFAASNENLDKTYDLGGKGQDLQIFPESDDVSKKPIASSDFFQTRYLEYSTGFLGLLDNTQFHYEAKDHIFKAEIKENVYSCKVILATTTQGTMYEQNAKAGGIPPGMYINDIDIVYRPKSIK